MTTIITGANGFIGENLVKKLSSHGAEVIAFQSKRGSLQALPNNFELMSFDLADTRELEDVIKLRRPNKLIHLAAQNSPNYSWENIHETMVLNFNASINIVEALRKYSKNTEVVMASSSAVYKENLLPINEDQICRPSSPYGVSKFAMEQIATLYSDAYGMNIRIARPFFVIGPKKIGDVCSDWARQVVGAEKRGGGQITTGEIIGVTRDFISVSDAVSGILAISNYGRPGEAYNISSGNGTGLDYVLRYFIKNAKVNIDQIIDSSKNQPNSDKVKIGNNTKLKSLGWNHLETVDSTLSEILDYWRVKCIQ
jgi:GDP-4-dehydro-6-deoxy-D-mannose reductase